MKLSLSLFVALDASVSPVVYHLKDLVGGAS